MKRYGVITFEYFTQNQFETKKKYFYLSDSSVIDKILKSHPMLIKKFPKKKGLCRVLIYKHIISKYGKPVDTSKKKGGDEKLILQFKTILNSFLKHLIEQQIRTNKLENNPLQVHETFILLPEILQSSGSEIFSNFYYRIIFLIIFAQLNYRDM